MGKNAKRKMKKRQQAAKTLGTYKTRSKVDSGEPSAKQSKEKDTKVETTMATDQTKSTMVTRKVETKAREHIEIDKDISIVRNILPKRKRAAKPIVVQLDADEKEQAAKPIVVQLEADEKEQEDSTLTETKCSNCGDIFSSKEILKLHTCHSLWIRHGGRKDEKTTEIELNNEKGGPCGCCLGSHNKLKNLSFNLKTLRWSNDNEPMTRNRALVRAKQMLNRINAGRNPQTTWFKCVLCDKWSDDLIDILFGHDELKDHIENYHKTSVRIYKKIHDKVSWTDEVTLRRFQNVIMNKHDEEYDYQLWSPSPMWRKIVGNKCEDDTKEGNN